MPTPSEALGLVLISAVKASVVLGGAFLVSVLLRRVSAATRHAVWLAALGGVLALPLAGALLPRLDVSWLRAPAPFASLAGTDVVERAPEALVAATAPSADVVAAPVVAGVHSSGSRGTGAVAAARVAAPRADVVDAAAPMGATPVRAPHGTSAAGWPVRLMLLWIAGVIGVAVAFAVGVLRAHVLACGALASGAELGREVDLLAESLGIRRAVRLLLWDGPAMPMTWGALRPVVLLPAEAAAWPAARRREVLLHELAHVRRGDWTARLLAATVCALHWFNPLAWLAAARLRNEQEHACDDAVLARGVPASDYANHLLEVARGLRVPLTASATVAMARPSQLTGRLLAVLDAGRRRSSTPWSARLTWLVALAAVIPLAAATPAPRGMADGGAAGWAPRTATSADVRATGSGAAIAFGNGGSVAAAAATAPVSGVAAVAVATEQDGPGCPIGSRTAGARAGGHTGSHSSSVSRNDDPAELSLSISEGGCRLELRMHGDVRFTDDETDIASVPRGASIRISEEDDVTERRFDAFWRDGTLVRRFRVDGRDVPESPELRAWLAATLQAALIRSGLDAVPRALRAYRAGGMDSLLALTGSVGSDYVTRLMLQAALDSLRLSPAEGARVARATRTMRSDYDRAELLLSVAGHQAISGAVQDAMVEAAGTMGSDYERRRVLTAALARRDLSPTAAAALMRSAGEMNSDFDKAELLTAYLDDHALAEAQRTAFFTAVGSMRSAYERRRVLEALIARRDAPASLAGEVCTLANTMDSDYDRAEVLVKLARRFGDDVDARRAIARTAEGIHSEFDRRRVLDAVGVVER